MRTHADHQTLAEMSETARLDRLRRILEILDDRPHFDFYTHEHPEEAGQQFHVRGADSEAAGPKTGRQSALCTQTRETGSSSSRSRSTPLGEMARSWR